MFSTILEKVSANQVAFSWVMGMAWAFLGTGSGSGTGQYWLQVIGSSIPPQLL